jgi:hypothetical protein
LGLVWLVEACGVLESCAKAGVNDRYSTAAEAIAWNFIAIS